MEKTRVTLSLDKYSYTLLNSIAEDLGQTKSAVFIELMHLMGPALSHISSVKRMVDAGLKATGEEAFKGFLNGMKQDFEDSITDAQESFFSNAKGEGQEAEHMQADAPEATRRRKN